ncbi:MAG: LysM peptidoglycan-binding domain-containing protein [Flavobacteriaceae bacterium]
MRGFKYFLVLLFFGCGLTSIKAQQNFKSVLKDSVAPDGYLYHKITAQDNFKSLSKLYDLSKGQIKRLNPLLRRGFKEGLLIKLPANPQLVALINQYNATKDKNKYIVQHQDTKFGIAKRYGISIQELERLNPKIRQGLQENDTLFVPKAKIQEVLQETDEFLIHKVEKGDTFYNLIRRFNVTQEELNLLNPDLTEGLKRGMYLRIPKIKPNISPRTLTRFSDSIAENISLNVLILLPFKTSLDSIPFDNISTASKLRNIVSEFYFGTEMALDSIAKQGVSIHTEVYDTENNKDTLNVLFETHNFSNFDLVVGPLFTKNINQVNQKLADLDTYIISPFSTSTKAINYGSAKIVQPVPLQNEFTKKTVNYIADNYTNEKLIIVTDTMPKATLRLNSALATFRRNDSINIDSIVVVKPIDGYIERDTLQAKIDTITKRKNWILTLTTDDVLIEGAINSLGVMPKESYDMTLFTIGLGKAIDKMDNTYLARLSVYYPSATYTDFTSVEISAFDSSFLRRYNNLPSTNAYKGFDMVYDALARLARKHKLIDKESLGVSRRTAHLFDYTQSAVSNKIFNKGVFLLKYEGLSIKMVE